MKTKVAIVDKKGKDFENKEVEISDPGASEVLM